MKYLTATLGALLVASLAIVATSASAEGVRNKKPADRPTCHKCPPSKNYDSTEVIKKTRTIDHSQIKQTQTVVPTKRLIEHNHLVIHENETRHVGTIQHNHTIIEKEVILTKRNVDHRYVNTEVNLVQHKYKTERKRVVEYRHIPGVVRHLMGCNCHVRPLRAYGRAPKYIGPRY